MNLGISYKLTGKGWAECEILYNGKLTVITASYLSDALGNLADATLRIAQGETVACAVFAEEPGEYEWKLERIGEKELLVEILWFDDWKGIKQTDEKGKIILHFECNTLIFVRRMIICLSETLNKYGIEGYKEEWGKYEFPLKVYNELRNILPTLK